MSMYHILSNRRPPDISTPAFSTLAIVTVPHFPLPHFQRPQLYHELLSSFTPTVQCARSIDNRISYKGVFVLTEEQVSEWRREGVDSNQ